MHLLIPFLLFYNKKAVFFVLKFDTSVQDDDKCLGPIRETKKK